MTEQHTLEALVLDKHQALAAVREWQKIAAALALEYGEHKPDGSIVVRVPKSLLNRLNHSFQAKPLSKGGVVLTLTPNKEGD